MSSRFSEAITGMGRGTSKVVSTLNQAGRDSVEALVRNVLPFLALVSLLIGVVTVSGMDDLVARAISGPAGDMASLLAVTVVCALPFLSPMLGPGALVAQVLGTLVGTQIAAGRVPPQFALPALFAINPQAGCDFIPVGLSLAEAEPETVEVGVPAMLISRLITGPLAVVIAFGASYGLYSKSD
jgi:glucitol/sorbitol PTS system EIIB component